MNALGELARALSGWLDLLLARPGAAAHFNATRAGLINATGFYFAAMLFVLVLESMIGGFPGWPAVLLSIAVGALCLGAIWLVIWVTARLLGASGRALAVPLTYAMGLLIIIAWAVGRLAGVDALILVIVVRMLMFYRAAREMGKLGIGISTAFAILCVAALAAIPPGLYMLVTSGQGIG